MSTVLASNERGKLFPSFNGELLSWSIGAYQTPREAQNDYPRMRTVIRAMLEHGMASAVEHERREMVKASFDPVFGNNAKVALRVIEEELNAAAKGGQ